MMRHNKISLVFVFVACTILRMVNSNLILSISSTSNQVNSLANISVNIRTSVAITTLDIVLSNAFTISNPNCRVNGAAATCNRVTPSTGTNIIIRYTFSFAALTNFTLSFNVTNPSYSDSFQIQAFNGATSFSNSITLEISPKSIVCSMSSSSSVVSQQANATFLIGVSTMAAGSIGKISMSVNSQTIFPNVINSNPTCLVDNSAATCDSGQLFGAQVLTIYSVNVGVRANGASLNLLLNSVRNSPYNSSFENISILVRDSLDRDIEACSLLQPPSTTLQQSSFLAIQGWNSLVGSLSNVQFLVTPFFTPLSNIVICLVIESSVSITAKAPSTQIVTTSNGYNYIKISNATYVSQVLRFNATFENPSSVIPLSLSAFILYNQTLFRQQKSLSNGTLALKIQTATLSVNVANPITLVSSTLNLTLTTPIKLIGGFFITFTIQYGDLLCSNLGFSTSLPSTNVTSCQSAKLILKTSTDIASLSSFWFNVNYQTYSSIISNTVSLDVKSISNNPIMNGSAFLSIGISSPLFSITSSNSTFTSLSNYTFLQRNVTTINSTVKRSVVFIPPTYVKITDSTSVVSSGANGSVVSFNLDLSSNMVNAVIQGAISVIVLNIRNPTHYLGGRDWTIKCKDLNGYGSSQSVSTQSTQYSPARSSITVSLTNQTIQQASNLTITYEPLLQYNMATPPLLTTILSASSINRVTSACPSCTLLTSTKFTMPYYAVVMRPTIQIINNKDPNGNSIDFTISISDFIYEVGSISYILSPLQFQFVSSFQGEYANLGQLLIRITSVLSTQVTLKYTGISNVFSSDTQCQQCNSSYLLITGLVGYFEAANVVIDGYANGTLYARGVVVVQYTCSQITGCQICETVNSTLMCSRCFSSQFTRNNLLYDGICYSVCPSQTYQNGAVCSACPNLCYRCNSVVCLECITAYYIYQQTCVSECPPLYIKNATHCLPRPVICPSNCIDCPSDNVCQKCDANFYLLENLCYTACPTNYIPNQPQAICELYIPPQQTDYFPFAFFIASVVVLVLLRIIKFFEKRSLIVGNFISFVSLMEIGAIILMISYTFISINTQPKRWINNNKLLMQALIFIIILTKVTLNLIFMAYFLRKIANDENFQSWLSKSPYNYRLYIVLLILSSVFSFQIMRVIYCRFLGLQIFFGRFNTSLIFKPINYFSIAYIVPGGGLIVMAIFDIIMQDGYRTSIFYSSIQVILIEILVLISCIFEGCRSDREYFDFQIYKVENQSENAHSASKINIMEQQQVGGSINQMLMNSNSNITTPVGYDPDEVGNDTAGKIIRNKRWREVKKKPKNLNQIQQKAKDSEEEKSQIIQEGPSNQIDLKLETNSEAFLIASSLLDFKDKSKEKSLFRKKILQDWQKLQKKLPHVTTHKILKKSSQRLMLSKSPVKKKTNKMTKVASLEKIEKVEAKTAIPSFKNKKKLKNYFYKISKQNQENVGHQQIDKDLNSIENIDSQTAEEMKNIDFINGTQVYQNTDLERQDGQISEIQNNQIEQSFEKSLLQLKKDFKANRYDDFDNSIIQEDEQQKDEISKNKELNMNSQQFGAQKRKIKKRNVNKRTEAVYLQRLVSSSETQRPKALRRQKLQYF